MKKKLFVIAATTLVASSAFAQSAFEGFNAQLGAGYNSYSPSITDQPGAGNTTPATSFSYGNGGSAALRAGLGYTASINQTFTIGGLVEYDILNSKKVNVVTSDNQNFTMQQKNKTTFSILPGVAIDKSTLAYLKLGYSTFKAQLVGSDGASDSTVLGSYNYGIGVKKLIDKNLYAFGEGNYSSGTSKTQAYSDGNGSTKFSGNSYNLIVGVGYKF